jgi:outer membrane lipoprotein-sorting protein
MIPTGPGEQRGGARVARSWLRQLGRSLLVACLWLGLASAAAGAELGEADKADVARIAAYLNDVRSLKARFIQVGPNGELAQGDLYLRRPGRLRFEYDPPSPLLLVADGFWLILQDKELEQVSRWPVNDTPLGVLVADDIELDGRRTRVTEVGRRAGVLTVTLIGRVKI